MADPKIASPVLPDHIEETIRSIDRLHAEHRRDATPLQRAVDRVTTLLGRPGFILLVTVIVALWVGGNLLAVAFGHRAIDPPPFSGLAGAISLASLYMVVLILATQRREDQLARHREQLILELALLSEQKTAKVIELLEEFRRNSPLIHDRVDRQADSMAQPADPQQMLDAIKEIRAEAAQLSGAASGAEDKGPARPGDHRSRDRARGTPPKPAGAKRAPRNPKPRARAAD
jgi:uncharacterized membrane protein